MTIVPAGQAIARIGQFAAIIPSYKYTIVVLIKYSMPVLSLGHATGMPGGSTTHQHQRGSSTAMNDLLREEVVVY